MGGEICYIDEEERYRGKGRGLMRRWIVLDERWKKKRKKEEKGEKKEW